MTTDPHSSEMPVFPLGTVLLPGQLLPLQVFEPRYRVLLFDLRDRDPAEFVVTMIERGSEVGGGDVRAELGCVARILSVDELPGGRSLVSATGTRRVKVTQWLPEDPYPRAMVSDLGELPWPSGDGDLVGRITNLARSVVTRAEELGAAPWPRGFEPATDPVERGWQLALMTPLATIDRQRLLSQDDPIRRWHLLETLLNEQLELLQARLAFQNRDDGPDTPDDSP